jgi:uncharacterized membrane protein
MLIDNVLRLKTNQDHQIKTDENLKRSLVKTVSWRIIGTIDTILISWIITGTLALAFSIGAIELITKMALYFFHERAWNTIKWGK